MEIPATTPPPPTAATEATNQPQQPNTMVLDGLLLLVDYIMYPEKLVDGDGEGRAATFGTNTAHLHLRIRRGCWVRRRVVVV